MIVVITVLSIIAFLIFIFFGLFVIDRMSEASEYGQESIKPIIVSETPGKTVQRKNRALKPHQFEQGSFAFLILLYPVRVKIMAKIVNLYWFRKVRVGGYAD